jgi:hypothetical protein
MVTTKSKLQMEFNKEVTSASSGLVYVCFGSFVKWSSRGRSRGGGAPGTRPPKIGKNMIFWRKIVIFHPPKFSRLPLLGDIFLSAPTLT